MESVVDDLIKYLIWCFMLVGIGFCFGIGFSLAKVYVDGIFDVF